MNLHAILEVWCYFYPTLAVVEPTRKAFFLFSFPYEWWACLLSKPPMLWELRLLIFILLDSAHQPKPVSSRVSGKCPLSLTRQCLPPPPPPHFPCFYFDNVIVNVTCLFGFSCECIDNLLQCNAVDTAIAFGVYYCSTVSHFGMRNVAEMGRIGTTWCT